MGFSRRWSGLIAGWFLVVMVAAADILPPDHHTIRHRVWFTNAAALSNHIFYVYPRDLERGIPGNSSVRLDDAGAVEVNLLNPLAVAHAQGVYLVAIPRGQHGSLGRPPQEAWFTNPVSPVIKARLPVAPIRSLPLSDSRTEIVEEFSIDGLPDRLELRRITAAPTTTTPPDPMPNRVTVVVLGGIAAAALVFLARRRSVWTAPKP